MLRLSIAFALLAAPIALAQLPDITGLPTCAVTCAVTSVATSSCATFGVSNITCICTSASFQQAWVGCEMTACNSTELTQAEAWGVQACASNGTPISISSNVTAPVSVGSSTVSSTAALSSSSALSSSAAATSAAATTSGAAKSSTAVGSSSAAPASSSKPAGAVRAYGGQDNTVLYAGAMVFAVVGGVAALF